MVQVLEGGLWEVFKPGVGVVWTAGVDPSNTGVDVVEKQSRLKLTGPTVVTGNSGSIASLNAGLTDPSADLIASHKLCI